ncbi:alpha/beta hydrolase [Actinacidiphila glaucinigra]|uniref:alpha/beta fold hydrolase n=1 Tax=Actinacidiphila glaucinigra TaxID=235986 RepID=UPI002DD84C57|nr:alpha/beta hydrolase [Actinacidiphila glaucinigra]WSD60286.1 alpha/beta hydrolase [Actinacidiphila glaucinigra]
MSRPPFLTLPENATAYPLETARGVFAVLDAVPPAGTPRRGTALLVPGFTGSKEDFLALLEPLAAAGYRTVAVDGRGQHQSPGPRDEAAYAQAELAADVVAQTAALATAAGEPVHLLGHSMGGLVVRAAVLAAHDEGAALPWASLTLMSSGPAAIEAAQQARTKLLVEALSAMDMESVWHAMRELDAEDLEGTANAAGAVEEFLHRRWLATVPEQLIVTGRQLIDEPDRVAELAPVPLPKLVLSGAVDYAWPVPWLDAMAERLGARRVVVEGAEHSPNAERPAPTARALAGFWGGAGPGA